MRNQRPKNREVNSMNKTDNKSILAIILSVSSSKYYLSRGKYP